MHNAYSNYAALCIIENKLASQCLCPPTVTIWHLQIITKSDQSLTLELLREDSIRSTHSQNHGKLLVHAEECVNSKTTIEMIFRCSDLENRDLFSKSVCLYFRFLLGIMWKGNYYIRHAFVCLAGSFFNNIKSCGRWYPYSNLQDRSYKEWSQPNMEASVLEYSTSRKQGINLHTVLLCLLRFGILCLLKFRE